ncbi:MAG: hypothetical protein K0R93_3695 [Anaerosolibacter sp.]|jgi:hypothetical protein|uniref:hypothetical protein n=1 Tax=Anaerosolibacter sp. TaxID=1872527 RepID=UPI002602C4DE|nr:hypothetical protein [Anaerosolibacter sp.]MDF2548797.1 hypothetical protein [Anaerosolibacter sp.]
MNIKFVIRKSNKTILTVKMQEAQNSILGELDIMIDPAKNKIFDKVVAGNYYMQFNRNIHAISWHGYYKNTVQNRMQFPTIHFKDNNNVKHSYKDVRHIGTVNSNEPFAFPICSLYIPQEDAWVDEINKSEYGNNTAKVKYHFKDMYINLNQRVDIFVTPKVRSAKDILDSEAGSLYKMADVALFNTPDGRFIPIKEVLNNPNIDYNSFIDVYSLENGHDLIIRTLGNQDSIFSELEGTYSLLVHDPNDMYNRMTNRVMLKYDSDVPENSELCIIKSKL